MTESRIRTICFGVVVAAWIAGAIEVVMLIWLKQGQWAERHAFQYWFAAITIFWITFAIGDYAALKLDSGNVGGKPDHP